MGPGLHAASILLSLLGAASAKPEYVDYYNYAPSLSTQEVDGYARISIPTEDGLSWYVNSPTKTGYCGQESPVRCVKIGSLVLAAPTGNISIGDNWALEGRKFRVISMGKMSLLGKVIPFSVVESSKGSDLYRYLLNHDLGVVAIIWPSRSRDETGEAYILGASKGVLSEGK